MHYCNFNGGEERKESKRELQTFAGCFPGIGIRISRRSRIPDKQDTLRWRSEAKYNDSQQRDKSMKIMIIIDIIIIIIITGFGEEARKK